MGDDYGVTTIQTLDGEPTPFHALWERHGNVVSLTGAVRLPEEDDDR